MQVMFSGQKIIGIAALLIIAERKAYWMEWWLLRFNIIYTHEKGLIYLHTRRDSRGSRGQTPLSDYHMVNTIANNQILAMLRSFGMLEAVLRKMIAILDFDSEFKNRYTENEKNYIKNQLKVWLPDVNEVSLTDNIVCKDEQYPTVILSVADISLTSYFILKKY